MSKLPKPVITKAWIKARVTVLASLAVMYVSTGGWEQEESIALIGIISEGIVSAFSGKEVVLRGIKKAKPRKKNNS